MEKLSSKNSPVSYLDTYCIHMLNEIVFTIQRYLYEYSIHCSLTSFPNLQSSLGHDYSTWAWHCHNIIF